jgi:hypothetical protein
MVVVRNAHICLLILACVGGWSAEKDAPFTMENDILHNDKPVKVSKDATGRYWRSEPLNGFDDPIAAPVVPESGGKSFDAKTMKTFADAYVDAIEQKHQATMTPPFAEWLKAHPDIRRDFWLALSPQFDEAKAAVAVLETLRQHKVGAVEKYYHLAIAIAVVFDTPDALLTSRLNYLWAVTDSQFSPQRPYLATFDYFTDKANQARFTFKPDQLPWPILVHLVDLDIDDKEIAWAWKNCDNARKDIASLYQTVPYDNDKLARKTPKLGTSDYTLENLRVKGGVCVDQAHYTSRVAKAFGVPSMKVAGEGRYGASSLHAWSGFLINAHGRAQLDFTGRYQGDNFYTGDIFDPQTRTMILDREVAMLYDGISLSFFKYQDSAVLSRAALKLVNADAKAAMTLAQQAIDRNTYNPNAWRLLAYGVSTGAIDQKTGNGLVARMMKDLANHPDLTLECLQRFMAAIPEGDLAARQKIYNKAYELYVKRPDLQIQLRLLQCGELISAKHQADSLQIALQTCTVNAKEGSLILPLINQIVESSRDFAASNPKFQTDVVKQALAKIEKDFPQKRGNEVSAAYEEYKKMVGKL